MLVKSVDKLAPFPPVVVVFANVFVVSLVFSNPSLKAAWNKLSSFDDIRVWKPLLAPKKVSLSTEPRVFLAAPGTRML
jgi:hypothetical protein